MESKASVKKNIGIFDNLLILDSIFRHLSVKHLRNCRLVNWLWNGAATKAMRKSFKTRLLLCADTKCSSDLKKLMGTFKNGSLIPYTKGLLLLDHFPSPIPSEEEEQQQGESDLSFQIAELFAEQFKMRPAETYSTLFKTVPPQNRKTVKAACEAFSGAIESLIINMTLYRDGPENMEHWSRRIYFPNITDLSFHLTRTSPKDLSHESLLIMMNSFPNLRTFGIRKLTEKGDRLLNAIMFAFAKMSNLKRVQNLSLEIYTDDNLHLEYLLPEELYLKRLCLIYLGGEIRFVEKMEVIKQFLLKMAGTLEKLHTHIPLFSKDQRDLPILPKLKTLKVEKVYREFTAPQANIFDFDFSRYYPNIENIIFKDYDIWKNMALRTSPPTDILPCKEIKNISLPDLCFDVPLMQRYLTKFPYLQILSLTLSYVSRYQKQCSFCLVYAHLPYLKELNVSIFEVDIPMYDKLFTGLTEEKAMQLLKEDRKPDESERELSILKLKELEMLRITSVHGNRYLGLSDLSAIFGFLEMPSLRKLIIGSSHITSEMREKLAQKLDLIICRKSDCTCTGCRQSAVFQVPENKN